MAAGGQSHTIIAAFRVDLDQVVPLASHQQLAQDRGAAFNSNFGCKIMKAKNVLFIALTILIVGLAPAASYARGVFNQAPAQPKVSDAEAKALAAINSAPDAAAKLTAAEEFAKNYPKSAALPQLADQIAIEISKVADTNQKIALADRFEKAFTDERALSVIRSAKLDSYVTANRLDDAFTLATTILAKDPEEVHTLVQLTLAGTEEAKKGNRKHMAQTQQYGNKAIQLIEANKKPVGMDDPSWETHKSTLPTLYQETGILAMLANDSEQAKARLSKAIALKPDDPSSHAILAYLINNEYVQQATAYKTMPEGKEKADTLKKLEGMIDNIIDAYAHTVALSTGKPEYQALLQQVLPDLTSYYKFRHNQSTEGLQQLIDKYKPQSGVKP